MSAAATITATDNLDGSGATVNISGSLGAQNYVEWLTAAKEGYQSSGIFLVGDGTVKVPCSPLGPLDTQTAFYLRVRSESPTYGTQYSNQVLVCPTKGLQSPQTDCIIGVQQQLILANIANIGMQVWRAEDSNEVMGTIGKWPGIMVQKSQQAEKRVPYSGSATGGISLTSWEWPVLLQLYDRQMSAIDQDEAHNYYRITAINLFDRITKRTNSAGQTVVGALTSYPRCTRTTVEPGPIQTYTVAGSRQDGAGGYAMWVSQLTIWCKTDMPIGGFQPSGV